ncbi:related to ACB 4-hydroxyacetophenone monooxygenase [Phialocephala subalpina]|uniref:Related to ACB 4-hydroxyacetophenone monooxygenase n=1 Tax=Phialocephala subalpina TaxID=576137 RepID=A0A1L7X7E9_9HELO|nr:related to ACB 4-hydroxyacetophenone monooxygenase [Phialocephala subalpina]
MASFLDSRPDVIYGNSIRKDNGYDAGSYTYYPVAIIGAGESGIAMGCRLKEVLGHDQFRIFDRQSGIGGTWWINRYPGVACDVPAIFYSFSFCPNPKWTTFYPSGPEIVKYLQGVCDQYEIVDKFQLNTDVRECRWLESEQVWELTLEHLMTGYGDLSEYDRAEKIRENGRELVYVSEEKIRAKVVVSCVGGLVEPKVWPEKIPGKDKFQGEIFHSARWRYDVDMKDKDVVVVGSGCSAAQFVPRLTSEYGAKSVTQLMRSPPWVVPKTIPPLGNKGWEKWSPWLNTHIPGFNKAIRFMIAAGAEYDWRLFGSGDYHEKERRKLETQLLARMKSIVPEKYHEILTPNYGVGCKRRIFDKTWFESLNGPAVELTTLPLTSIGEKTVTLGPGRTYPDAKDTTSSAPSHEVTIPADVIVLANGFETTKWLHPLDITGRGGKKLHDVYDERGGAQMYMGMALDGFPNFFTIFGPNTATGHSSVILASENMINMSLKFIGPMLKGDVAVTEIKKEAELEWARDTQAALKKRVWNTGGCMSWYQTEAGWNSTVYPYTQIWFGLRCMFPTWKDWDITYTRKGRAKRAGMRAAIILGLLAAITTIIRLRRTAQGRGVKATVADFIRAILLQGAAVLQIAGSKV